jgi:putative MFS transporter
MPTPSRAERLDRLPFTPLHRKLLWVSGLGWAMDAMDVGLISFVLPVLATQWGLGAGALSWLGAVGFVGMAVGAGLGGTLADRYGRRGLFSGTLLVYGLATAAAAAADSVWALGALRFLIGLGLGAELPVVATLVSEFAPARVRGRVVVLLEAFWALGWVLAALVGTFVVSQSEAGWRWAFLIGALPALYSVVVRRTLPESVRFLEGRGRHAEAEAVVRQLEAAAGTTLPPEPSSLRAPPAAPAPESPGAAAPGPGALWSPGLRGRTAALWAVWFTINFGYYGAFIWLPTLLVERGFSLVRSFAFTLVMTLAQLPGYAVAAWLIERWGRRPTLASFLLGSVGAALLFAGADTPASILAAGMLLSFFNLGAWGALYAATPEVYPTRVRATGSGWAAGFGRLASILAPLSVPPLLALGGVRAVFLCFALAFGVGAAAALGLPELRGRHLAEGGAAS